jgi:tRNA-specific 2-thiouridylase
MKKTVVVGMSGGVDSAVSALLLKQAGYDVVALYMSNWRETEGGACRGEEDYYDVKRICGEIGIPYYSADFSDEYMEGVFKFFLEEYKAGRTPNPDVLCNREIKFSHFKKFALEMGADFVATGHYAKAEKRDGINYLKKAADQNKDQTYFLNQLTSAQLDNVLFPVGDLIKNQVREIAEQNKISVARKKDSTGICFVGERKFREFLSRYIPMKEGDIVDKSGKVVGRHKGVFYYTIGQRRGLGIGGNSIGESWYVLDKDVLNNRLIVSQGEDGSLFSKSLTTAGFNFISQPPASDEFDCEARIRHRQPLQKARAKVFYDGGEVSAVRLEFATPQRAVAAGQYAVIYQGEYCLGGGVICDKS